MQLQPSQQCVNFLVGQARRHGERAHYGAETGRR
jgi:hypothetical protein